MSIFQIRQAANNFVNQLVNVTEEMYSLLRERKSLMQRINQIVSTCETIRAGKAYGMDDPTLVHLLSRNTQLFPPLPSTQDQSSESVTRNYILNIITDISNGLTQYNGSCEQFLTNATIEYDVELNNLLQQYRNLKSIRSNIVNEINQRAQYNRRFRLIINELFIDHRFNQRFLAQIRYRFR